MTPLGDPIAAGRTGEVYAWQDGQILKLLKAGYSPASVEREARASAAVHALGLPVPAIYEPVEIGGRQGLVFERIDGPTMTADLMSHPWRLIALGRRLAELHFQVHAYKGSPELPSQRERLRANIGGCPALSEHLRTAVLERLGQLPDGDRLCHGDMHPDQVLMSRRGPIVIDWVDAKRGNPLADVARSSVVISGTKAMPAPAIAKLMARAFHAAYLRRYLQLRPGARREIEAWRPIMAAARLNEGIKGLQEWLLAQVRAGLALS